MSIPQCHAKKKFVYYNSAVYFVTQVTVIASQQQCRRCWYQLSTSHCHFRNRLWLVDEHADVTTIKSERPKGRSVKGTHVSSSSARRERSCCPPAPLPTARTASGCPPSPTHSCTQGGPPRRSSTALRMPRCHPTPATSHTARVATYNSCRSVANAPCPTQRKPSVIFSAQNSINHALAVCVCVVCFVCVCVCVCDVFCVCV
jgi:hypothetical protein